MPDHGTVQTKQNETPERKMARLVAAAFREFCRDPKNHAEALKIVQQEILDKRKK